MRKVRPFWFLYNKVSPFKKAINYTFWTFVLLGFYLWLFANQSDMVQNPKFMGTVAFAGAALIALPSFFLLRTWVERVYNIHLIVVLEAIIAFSFILDGMGAFGLYRIGVGYDSFVHFFNGGLALSVLIFLVGYIIMERYWLKPRKMNLILITIIFVFIIGIIWEWLEVVADQTLSTKMAGDPYALESYRLDTLKDIMYNTIGSLAGIILAALYGERWLKGLKKQKNWQKFVIMMKELNQRRKKLKNRRVK